MLFLLISGKWGQMFRKGVGLSNRVGLNDSVAMEDTKGGKKTRRGGDDCYTVNTLYLFGRI